MCTEWFGEYVSNLVICWDCCHKYGALLYLLLAKEVLNVKVFCFGREPVWVVSDEFRSSIVFEDFDRRWLLLEELAIKFGLPHDLLAGR